MILSDRLSEDAIIPHVTYIEAIYTNSVNLPISCFDIPTSERFSHDAMYGVYRVGQNF